MDAIVVAGVGSGAVAALAVVLILRPALAGSAADRAGGWMPWPVLAIAAASAAVVIVPGLLLGLGTPRFLAGIAAGALPVLVLLDAAGRASGAGPVLRGLLAGVWGLVVLPLAALVPLGLTHGCLAPECRFEDFGAALPLLASASAFLVAAPPPVAAGEQGRAGAASAGRVVVAGAVLWVSAAAWLAHLEGVLDEFVPRILLAAVIGPVAGAVGWAVVGLLRGGGTGSPLRWWPAGLVAGFAGIAPGAVSIELPGLAVAAVLAGALASLVFGFARGRGTVARWGLAVLAAAGVGLLAPAVGSENLGVVFFARWAVLLTPVLAFAAVTVLAVSVSAPLWHVVRRRAAETGDAARTGKGA